MAQPRPAQVAAVLGGESVLGETIRTAEQLAALVQRGLPYEALNFLVTSSHIGVERLAEVVGLSRATRTRRRRERTLSPEESDRLCRFARIYAHALDVFEDPEEASGWLLQPEVPALGKQISPIDLLRTDVGAQQVDTELGRIEYGIVS
jgi:putative toxin-antitoxin system antitoxin component (TIGR02293 family)